MSLPATREFDTPPYNYFVTTVAASKGSPHTDDPDMATAFPIMRHVERLLRLPNPSEAADVQQRALTSAATAGRGSAPLSMKVRRMAQRMDEAVFTSGQSGTEDMTKQEALRNMGHTSEHQRVKWMADIHLQCFYKQRIVFLFRIVDQSGKNKDSGRAEWNCETT